MTTPDAVTEALDRLVEGHMTVEEFDIVGRIMEAAWARNAERLRVLIEQLRTEIVRSRAAYSAEHEEDGPAS